MTSDLAAVAHIANEVHTTNHTDKRIASDLAAQQRARTSRHF
jgi:hypothetical protein